MKKASQEGEFALFEAKKPSLQIRALSLRKVKIFIQEVKKYLLSAI